MDELILRSLEGATTEAEERRLLEWRAASAENERTYRKVVRLAEAAALLREAMPRAEPPATVRLLARLDERVIRAGAGSARRPGSRWRVVLGAAVGAAALIAVGLGLRMLDTREGHLADVELVTGPGETTTATLGDGSAVRLAPETRLRVSPGSGAREVWLDGRAYFSVAKREGRLFRIRTQAGEAVVLGTRFDLEARRGDMRVVVVEGRVRVAAGGARAEVAAHQLGSVVDGGTPSVEDVEDVHELMRWMDDFFAFEGTPLRDVALELERRFGIRIEVRGEVAERRVTGWSSGRSAEDTLEAICRTIGAHCVFADDRVLIEP